MKLRQALVGHLSAKELAYAPSAYDMVGDIALFNEIPKELKRKERVIAEALLKINAHIKVVGKKARKYSGKLRLPKITIIGGERRKETIHKENNCMVKLDVEKCYFSARTGTERLRIMNQVKKNESVLVLFSGVAPLPCEIAKNTKVKEVYGIELNKVAHKYAVENVKINKVKNVFLFQGDVKKVLPRMQKKFDRIVLPLPKNAEKYLDSALKKLKSKGIVHLYSFAKEEDIPVIKKKYQKKFRSVNIIKCGNYAPHVYRICLDLKK